MKIKILTLVINVVFTFVAIANDVSHVWDDNVLKIEYNLENIQIDTISTGVVKSLSIQGFGSVASKGYPCLAQKVETFFIPDGFDVGSVSAECESDTIFMECKGSAGPIADILSDDLKVVEEYADVQPFKGLWPLNVAEYQGLDIYRDNQIGKVMVSPFQYDYENKRIIFNKKIKVTISLNENSVTAYATNETKHSIDMAEFKQMLTVPMDEDQGISAYGLPLLPITECPIYLIISPERFATHANKFAEWKRRAGYSVNVITPGSEILTNPSALHELIKEYYANEPKLKYLLLFGSGNYITPFKGKHGNGITYYTDYTFACMDDADGENDNIADLVIGRCPVSSSSEAETMVSKMIKYEHNPPKETDRDYLDYYLGNFILTEFEGMGPKDSATFTEATRKILQGSNDYVFWDKGFPSYPMYYANPQATPKYYNDGVPITGSELYPSTWRTTSEDVIRELNHGTHLFTCRGHGNWTTWTNMRFNSSHVSQLTNIDRLPIIFSITCQSGGFYHPGELNGNITPLCIRLLTATNGGAASAIGANHESYRPYNEYFYAGLFEAMCPGMLSFFKIGSHPLFAPVMYYPVYELGKVMQLAQRRMVDCFPNKIDEPYVQMNKEIFHCLGDPSMQVYHYIAKYQPLKFEEEEGKLVLRDPRYLILINKQSGKAFYDPNKHEWTLEELQIAMRNNELSMVGNFIETYQYVPLVITEEMLTEATSNQIESISKDGNQISVNVKYSDSNYSLDMFNIYGTRICSVPVTDKKMILDLNKGINIIGLSKDGVIVDSKQIMN